MSLVRLAHTSAADAAVAVEDLYEQLGDGMNLVLFFCSNQYDLDQIAVHMQNYFEDIEVIGTTASGEIGSNGYCTHSIAAVGFTPEICISATGHLDHLQNFSIAEGHAFAKRLQSSLEVEASFALMFIDGLSTREEIVAHTLSKSLGSITLVGGSASDSLELGRTFVYHNGHFHEDSAVVALVSTPLPFMPFKIQHLLPGNERLVVTHADTSRHMVYEINGVSAAKEYARVVNIHADHLERDSFTAFPAMVMLGQEYYARSVKSINDDGSITFYSAIDEGVVFRIAHSGNLTDMLKTELEVIEQTLGSVSLLLSFDSMLRKRETEMLGVTSKMGRLMQKHHAVGFNTCKEQYCGIHMNQTLTGIALGVLKS
jgi:hypothetical protein